MNIDQICNVRSMFLVRIYEKTVLENDVEKLKTFEQNHYLTCTLRNTEGINKLHYKRMKIVNFHRSDYSIISFTSLN